MPGLASLSKSLFSRFGERRAPVAIGELDDNDRPVTGQYIAFQYFPETITDTKTVHYNHREIPGGSLPIYQWVSSGERIISFTALFSSDVDLLQDPNSFQTLVQNGQALRNVDVRTALLWLRRFMLPRYQQNAGIGVPLSLAPRKLQLSIPNSGLGILGGDSTSGVSSANFWDAVANQTLFKEIVNTDSPICIMTQCDITFEAFFPSGLPRIASVQLQFAQVAQLAGAVSFPRAHAGLDNVVSGGRTSANAKQQYFPYNVRVNFK